MRVVHRGRSFDFFSTTFLFSCAAALGVVGCGYDAKTVPMGMSGMSVGGTGDSTSMTGNPVTSGSAPATTGSGSGASTGQAASGNLGMSGTPGGTGAPSGSSGSSAGTASGVSSGSVVGMGAKNPSLTYNKVTVHKRFLAESVAIGDFNKDGNPDIAAGKYWYPGPNFSEATAQLYRDGHLDLPTTGVQEEINTGVSDSWSAFAYDMDGDGWDDIIQIAASDVGTTTGNPIPAGTGYWYKNPKNVGMGFWPRYQISSDMRGEHKGYVDMNGDGKPEILGSCKLCAPGRSKGFWEANWANPTAQWTYHAITGSIFYPGGAGWVHGIGGGDVNGDGKTDLLERGGIWLQPANINSPWTFIPVELSLTGIDENAQSDVGGSHMYVYDVDGDGLNDIVTSLQSHGYGLAWFKQGPAGVFTIPDPSNPANPPIPNRQMIINTPAEAAMYNNVAFSQLHSLCLEDMDGDGLKDIVTGKTFLAHPYPTMDVGGDPKAAVVLYIFKLVRTPGGGAHFEPHLIDADVPPGSGSGVAREFRVADMNKDGIMDIVIASKRGLYVYFGKP